MQARLDSMAGRRVGYMKLKSFTARTQPDVAAAVKHLQVSYLHGSSRNNCATIHADTKYGWPCSVTHPSGRSCCLPLASRGQSHLTVFTGRSYEHCARVLRTAACPDKCFARGSVHDGH